jgi:hypothetical protein
MSQVIPGGYDILPYTSYLALERQKKNQLGDFLVTSPFKENSCVLGP